MSVQSEDSSMQVSFKWAAGAMGVLLFAATMSAQPAQNQQGQAGQATPAQGQQAAPAQGGQAQPPAQGAAPRGQGQGPAAGRQGGGGRGFTNLTVLPRDMPQPQLIQVMQGFEAALGVTCEHCHVYFGQGNAMNNMASDDKQPKKTARVMMVAARDMNTKFAADLGKPAAQVTPVMCGTCHRGKAIPDYVQPPPPARGGGPGAAPAGGAGGARQGGAN
jgi:hypothetical protein